MSEIIELSKKMGIKVDGLVELRQFDSSFKDDWSLHLQGRIRYLLRLKLLSMLLKNQFVVGYEALYEYIAEDYERVLGAHILDSKFTGQDIFDTELWNSFTVVAHEKKVCPESETLVTFDRLIAPKDQHPDMNNEGDVWVSEGIVITKDKLYVNEEMKKLVEPILSEFKKLGDEFVSEYRERSSVPHSVYIEWLLKWFPGRIHIRSLE